MDRQLTDGKALSDETVRIASIELVILGRVYRFTGGYRALRERQSSDRRRRRADVDARYGKYRRVGDCGEWPDESRSDAGRVGHLQR